MKARYAVLVALATAVTLASVAAAGPAATKQRVQIDMKFSPGKGWAFVLTPLQAGALNGDSGKLGRCDGETQGGTVVRDGQEVYPFGCRASTITGKRGTLVLRTQGAWAEAGGEYNIGTGTWKVVRGTGQYAGITGGGRIAQVGTAKRLGLARYQGFLTSR
jgi:hypothetical protein